MIAAPHYAEMRGMDADRELLGRYMNEMGWDYARLSKAIGRSHSYIQQYMKRGIPRELHPTLRQKVAEALHITEWLDVNRPRLMAVDSPEFTRPYFSAPDSDLFRVPEHDVRVSAGGGALIDDENVIGSWSFPRNYIRSALSIRDGNLSIVEVVGDSMEPTLHSGDRIMVDLADTNISVPGVFAIYDGDATVVKRLEKIPASDPPKLLLISDNPRHRSYEVPLEVVHVAGRVVWFGRRL